MFDLDKNCSKYNKLKFWRSIIFFTLAGRVPLPPPKLNK
jgi:hypothetical protein